MVFSVSSILSVSQKEKLNCEKMALFLSKADIITSISSNISTLPHIEYGCRLRQSISSKEDIEKIWILLKKKYDFKCAHVKVGDNFDGCILNYLSPTKCLGEK